MSLVHRHWDAPLIPTKLEQEIRKSERRRERQHDQNTFNECVLNCFHPHVLKYCTYKSRITLSHTSSRLLFLMSSGKDVWEDILEKLHDKIADIDLDMRDALEQEKQSSPYLEPVYVSKSDVQSLLALRKPDEQLKTLLRVLRTVLFDSKFEKWDNNHYIGPEES